MKLPVLTAATVTLVALSPLARAGSGGCDWSAKKGGGCGAKEETTASKKESSKPAQEGSISGEKEKGSKAGEKPVS